MGLFKPLVILATGTLLAVLLYAHVPYLNGPSFFIWPYRDLPGGRIYAAMIAAALPLLIAQFAFARWPRLVAFWLILVMLSSFGLKLASVAFREDVTGEASPSLTLISIIVKDRNTTSYFTDAATLDAVMPMKQWLTIYPTVMGRLNLHTQSKPPGPVMYWHGWITLLGLEDIDRTALIGGLVLGGIATLSIPATYAFLRATVRRRSAAFCGASFLALCPGFVLFFPMMDPTYILLSTALAGFWFVAIRRNRVRAAIACGITLGFCGIITFNVLVIGLFMAAMIFVGPRSIGDKLILAAKHGVVVIVSATVILLLLRATLNYDVIDTFYHAWINQHELVRQHAFHRQYPATIPFDLIDFAVGSGGISVVLCGFYFARRQRGTVRQLAWLAMGQLLIVAVTGLLQLETSRVWNFMLPLLMIPVCLELSHWPPRWRIVPLATMVLINAAVCTQLKWLY